MSSSNDNNFDDDDIISCKEGDGDGCSTEDIEEAKQELTLLQIEDLSIENKEGDIPIMASTNGTNNTDSKIICAACGKES